MFLSEVPLKKNFEHGVCMESRSSVNLPSPVMNGHHTACYMILGSLLLIAILFIIHQMYANGNSLVIPDLPYYTIILDCGSTGTRINVYEWSGRNLKDKSQLKLLRSFPDYSSGSHLLQQSCQYHCIQTEPGLDKFTYNSSGLSSALEPLLIWAEKNIPSDRHMQTPIFVLGTAGLRKLSKEKSKWVMRNVGTVVKKHKFIYRQSWIRVLTGEEEAYYAWVALNYKLGRLDKLIRNTTVGIIDLGGSSMQIAFEMKNSIDYGHYFKSKIGSTEHGLLTYSLAEFGLNDAFDRSISLLHKDPLAKRWKNGVYEFRHPCLNKGFTKNYTCPTCLKQWENTDPTFFTNDMFISQPPMISLVGYPNWIKCKALARAASVSMNSSDFIQLSKNMNCSHFNSISGGTENGSELTFKQNTHFHALSGFYFVYSSSVKNSKSNLTNFLEIGEELCSKTWADIERESGHQKFAEQSCFRIPYIVSLLKDALCLPDANISFGPCDISWTLGAALMEGELLQSTEYEGSFEKLVSKNMKAISFFLFLLATVLCIYSIVLCKRFKRVIMFLLMARRGVLSEVPLASFSPKSR